MTSRRDQMNQATYRHVCAALASHTGFNSDVIRHIIWAEMDEDQLQLVLEYYTPEDMAERFLPKP
jgi:hypothetical protein